MPADDLVPGSDVLGTGWFGAEAGPGKTVAVVGDGAVGLLAVLAARQFGAERVIRSEPARAPGSGSPAEYGATDVVTERGDQAVVRVNDLTGGLGAHSIIEAVGTQESMVQAIRSRASGSAGMCWVTLLPGAPRTVAGHLGGG